MVCRRLGILGRDEKEGLARGGWGEQASPDLIIHSNIVLKWNKTEQEAGGLPRLRFSAALSQEPEVEVALV